MKRKVSRGSLPLEAPAETDSDSELDSDLSEDDLVLNPEISEDEDSSQDGESDVSDDDELDATWEIAEGMREFLQNRAEADDQDADEDDLDERADVGAEKVADEPLSDSAEADVRDGLKEELPNVKEDSEDSEDDGELASRNTIGESALKFYKNEKHVGYDIEGKKISTKERKDELEGFLARADDSKDWRKIFDEYNAEEIVLTKEEINMIRRLREGKIPHAEVNPYEPYVDWFEYEDKGFPLSSAPEPKRRFIPSKHEAKKVVKLVRAIRNGWLTLEKRKEKPKYYLLWGDDAQPAGRTANGLGYIPAPKPNMPGHAESYNPPEEYIPTQEEISAHQLLYEEDRPKFLPRKYNSLREVPSYAEYIKEQFERCLDLYLCPRSRKKRINIDPESLIPKLPKPKDLQPFPTVSFLEYRGHTGAINSIATSPCGEWLASGSTDGSVRLWEIQTGRCRRVWSLGGVVRNVAWNPNSQLSILAIAVERDVVLVNTGVGLEVEESTLLSLLTLVEKPPAKENEATPFVTWARHEDSNGVKISHLHTVHSVAWHHKGDYFATLNPEGNTRAVLVHQLSKQHTQNPFRKHHGRVVQVLFHPSRPFLFVATKMHVRIYNLMKQALSKKLKTGLDAISSLAVHSGGDNLLVGSKDAKLCWFDMDLSTEPYKVIKNHKEDIRAVAYHKTYPLFATCSDDATTHVFHGMVFADLLQNPLIVPLKVLSGHQKGIFDCVFHPKQPWLFTAGADAVVKVYSN